jgi:hypothetical protein
MTYVKSTDHCMPGMATRERERRRHDDGESDSQKHYDSLPFHENMISSKAHDVNIKLQF